MTDSTKKNSLKVSLENFQSISKANLEFIQGINIIVGQSNSGKSAILRAIKGAITNPNGSQRYIKNGTKEFKVNLDYEGNQIEWSRSSKSPTYKINGESYQKVGGSTLVDILDKSGFVLYDGKELMNIESELELPFPFDKSNTELFKLFEKNIFCVSDSSAITKLIKADEDEVCKNRDHANYELDRYKNKLQAVMELEEEIDINKLINGRDSLSKLFKNKDNLTLDINNLSGIIVAGRILAKVVQPVEVNLNILHEYIALVEDLNNLEKIRGIGNILRISPEVPTSSVFNIDKYLELEKDINKIEYALKAESILSPLEALITKVIDEEYTSLRNDINTLSRLSEQAHILQKDLLSIKEKIANLEEEKKKFKVCPLCGGELNE